MQSKSSGKSCDFGKYWLPSRLKKIHEMEEADLEKQQSPRINCDSDTSTLHPKHVSITHAKLKG